MERLRTMDTPRRDFGRLTPATAQLANMPPHRPNKSANLPISQDAAAARLNVSTRSVQDADHGWNA
jgi:hypothetical protein